MQFTNSEETDSAYNYKKSNVVIKNWPITKKGHIMRHGKGTEDPDSAWRILILVVFFLKVSMFFTDIVINFQTLLFRHIHHALHVKNIRLFNRIDWWHLAIYTNWPIKQTVSLQKHKCVKVKKILRCNSETIPNFNRDKHYVLVIRTLIMSGRLNSNPCGVY